MFAEFNLAVFKGKNDRSGPAERAIDGGEIRATEELFPGGCLGG